MTKPYLEEKIKDRIENKLKALNELRPLPPSAVKKLQEQFKIEMTYNSNGIEGNSLTLKETFLVINEGITIKGKPLKDHLEAKNHYEALEFLSGLVEKNRKQTLSERLIRGLHQLVVQETEKEWAGKYRNSDVIIGGAEHKPPAASDVPYEMEKLIKWWKQNQRKLPIVELAALIHHRLVYIHPFFDGNGRVARLVMNLLLLQAGYPLVIVLKNDRKKYYRVLTQADKGNFVPFVRFIAQTIERSLDVYLKTLTPSSKTKEKFITLREASKICPYSAKYLNLLARQGKLEAHKEKRNWLTTKEAIERYIKTRERIR
ncbi:cell filamentation protein Fic [Candidatus Wolfebacteria bacterium CG1_02_39_135]|uniref:Cell filamentation protein Fic n=1 Tax=Candidatus Wolfebacteria bacterium CG1_02_39_135 TaxID=1805425 RepID=A0A1J4XUW4_9BACT|nr:Fic family protein [Parcubacteria group bacterium]OIO65548.1 MAG: cell filamentation protein Fic [Candidatus Wolfebacteria bacterium CG1_02_39_135]